MSELLCGDGGGEEGREREGETREGRGRGREGKGEGRKGDEGGGGHSLIKLMHASRR